MLYGRDLFRLNSKGNNADPSDEESLRTTSIFLLVDS